MAEQTEQEKIRLMLANDPHCKKVSEPTDTQVTLLPKAAVPVIKSALKQ